MANRPQVGIERLPARRMSNEPRESMNYQMQSFAADLRGLSSISEPLYLWSSCPSPNCCNSTDQLADAVPKKRGPKTDVLEALLRRVDGLERRLKDEEKPHSPDGEVRSVNEEESVNGGPKPKRPQLDTTNIPDGSAVYSPPPPSAPSPAIQPDTLLDTYFTRCHGKAYHILDETTTRQRIQLNDVPSYLLYAIYAVSARYTAHPNGYHAAVRLSEDYAIRARTELDIDEPNIDTLQSLLLLSVACIAAGKGKKAYMLLASGIGMAVALELHREFDLKTRATPVEREMRRRLFWTCYLMDRFTSCGSKRPSLIADESIVLRLPAWSPTPATLPVEGEFFQNGSNLQYHSGSGKKSQGSSGMLIDIVRILGITNRYLAAGGVKGDSHFPWHSLSNLSKIRQDLDIWASGTQDVFSSVDTLFGQTDSTTLVLSKLVYHLIHCLIYRPFLPIDLAELAGTGQHQSWQIEATNLCFLHANAIAELVELGKQSSAIEWPAFVGYCICTAGTVHVHGAHYNGSREEEVFSASTDFLSREMQQLSELRYVWSSVQHQRETLQTIYGCHSELVKSLSSNPMRYSPVFHLEDFFDRYNDLGQFFDGAHISFAEIIVDPTQDTYIGHGLYAPRSNASLSNGFNNDGVPPPKHKSSTTSRKKHDMKVAHVNTLRKNSINSVISPTDFHENRQQIAVQQAQQQQQPMLEHIPMTSFQPNGNGMPTLAQTSFSPPYAFSSMNAPEPYDPMFGVPNMNNSIPGSVDGGVGALNGGYAYGMEGQPVMTPGGRSQGESTGTGGEEKDPFLSLLEQLAENEHSRGGPSELDFFLSGGNG
ncbi:putative transcriptional regulatory [Hyphodiscus hymeniophilus]|uniref:Transcriptional regulatory n=1 Tax=Hyphodiscus hymeniophilus TaxID=353542 RepID=A0A9P7AUM5_9HELO|nr:putative transcriptional regulatory [Hyphodiscus hymeniophilus]